MDSAIALGGDGIQPKDAFPTGSAEEEADVAKSGLSIYAYKRESAEASKGNLVLL